MTKNETYTDPRDGKTYSIIEIGNQVLMAENFAYRPSEGKYWAYDNNPSKAAKYGYLYDWVTAQKVVPKGWHIPSHEEWVNLYLYLGNDPKTVYSAIYMGGTSGFNALAGGLSVNSVFNSEGNIAGFWSSSEKDSILSWAFTFMVDTCQAAPFYAKRNTGFSIRLFKDIVDDDLQTVCQSEQLQISESKGNTCTVGISGVEWQKINFFWEITKITRGDNGYIVIDPPMTSSITIDGNQSLRLDNDGSFKAIKINCFEAIVIFGDDRKISVYAGREYRLILQIFRADSEVKPIKNAITILETQKTVLPQAEQDFNKSNVDWKDRQMPLCPKCGIQLSRPELCADNVHKVMDFLELAIDGKGIILGNCSTCEKEFAILSGSPEMIFKIVQEISS